LGQAAGLALTEAEGVADFGLGAVKEMMADGLRAKINQGGALVLATEEATVHARFGFSAVTTWILGKQTMKRPPCAR
jgi:hypothetical protein